MTAVDLRASIHADPFLGRVLAHAAGFSRALAIIADDVAEPLAGILTVPLEITRTGRFGRLCGTNDVPLTVQRVDPGDIDASRGAGFTDH
jgi:hypothetical protein